MTPPAYFPLLAWQRGVRWLIAFSVLTSLVGCSRQADYPNRPLLLVCPWAQGGGTDRVSRVIAAHLEGEIGAPVSVVNAVGGKGATGHNRGLSARPDGYTLTMTTLELNMMHWNGLTSLTIDDCVPLMSLNEDYAALFVRADAPWQTLAELQSAVQQQPGSLKASGTTSGGAWHLAIAGWLQSLGMSPEAITWISSSGSAPSLQELLSGGLDMVCCSLPEADTFLNDGQIRCLGVMSEKRAPGYPEVSTFAEQGSNWTLGGWRAIAVPVGTPPEIQQRLITALEKIVTGQTRVGALTFPEFMDQSKFDHTYRQGAELVRFLQDNDKLFGKLLTTDEMRSVNRDPFPPMLFPYLVLGAMGVVLVLGLGSKFGGGLLPAATARELQEGHPNYAGFVLVLGSVLFYCLLAETIGFILAAGAVL
ncbi:MAG: hypothetical protein KDA92_26360, partial [Planctomycetales bacterium]|nr:hypothetical protein [Planctomycetales bacterium]